MTKDELLKVAREAGLEVYKDRQGVMHAWVEGVIVTPDIESLVKAILERAAVECENRVESVSMHATARDCANFNAGLHSGAASIRVLKTENSV